MLSVRLPSQQQSISKVSGGSKVLSGFSTVPGQHIPNLCVVQGSYLTSVYRETGP